MKRLDESSVLWLKKWAGLLTEEEERSFFAGDSMLLEGIQFGFEIPHDINRDLFIKDSYSLALEFMDTAKRVPGGKEFLEKIKDRGPVFVEDWSSHSGKEDSSSTVINFYLGYKAEESDRKVLMNILNAIEDRAMELGFKLGEYKYETSESKEHFDHIHNFKKEWTGRTYKKEGQDISSVRVINIPVEIFPEKDDILDHSVDMNHAKAAIIFNLMGIAHMDHGVLENEDIPKYLRNLIRARNSDLSSLEIPRSSSGGDLKRHVDKSSDVPSIATSRSVRIVDMGVPTESILASIDEMIELLKKAQSKGLNIQWN